MTDRLPEWLESWLDENSIHPFAGSSFRAVSTYDLRAFLAQFVLCEREPVVSLSEMEDVSYHCSPHPLYGTVVHNRPACYDGLKLYKAAGGGEG